LVGKPTDATETFVGGSGRCAIGREDLLHDTPLGAFQLKGKRVGPRILGHSAGEKGEQRDLL